MRPYATHRQWHNSRETPPRTSVRDTSSTVNGALNTVGKGVNGSSSSASSKWPGPRISAVSGSILFAVSGK